MTTRRLATLAFGITLCLAGVQGADARNCLKADADYRTCSLSTGCTDGSSAPSSTTLRFAQLSDVHIYDDDGSPAFNGSQLELALEPTIANGSAQRLQDEYTDEVLNAMVATINQCDEGSRTALMIATGDNIDTMTLNELRRYIDNLDGVGSQTTAYEANCGYLTKDSNQHDKLGTALPCPLGAVLEIPTGQLVADSQSNPPTADEPALTRSPRQNVDTTLSSAVGGSLLVAPGLPDVLRCDDPKTIAGLDCQATPLDGRCACVNHRLGIPYFAVFGNHDGAVRGTLTMQRPFQAGTTAFGRYFLQSQREWINEFFATQTAPDGHGFNFVDGSRWNDPDDRNDGYYSFGVDGSGAYVASDSPSAVVRMIVLNTLYDGVQKSLHGSGNEALLGTTEGLVSGGEVTNPAALESGALPPEQFDWLKGELHAAASAGTPALVFSHHPDRSIYDRQYGFPIDVDSKTAKEFDQLLGCARYDASTASGCAANPGDTSKPASTLVAHIAGHTHENIIRACKPGAGCPIETGNDPLDADVERGFWRVETASLIDYPQEGRIIELFPSGAGWGLRLTMIEPDQTDGNAALSRRLSIAEATCNLSQMIGGPLRNFPTDQASFEERLANLQSGGEAAVQMKFCQEGLSAEEILASAAGDQDDRDVILLP